MAGNRAGQRKHSTWAPKGNPLAITVSDSVTSPEEPPKALTFDEILDLTAKLQREKSDLDRRIKELKVPGRAELKARGLPSYTTPNGTQASVFETNRTNADKKEAERRVAEPGCSMDGDDFAAIFKTTASETYKVK